MNERRTDETRDRPPVEAPADPQPPMLAATIDRSGDRPATCTLHPPDATDAERVTAWLTAEADAFVDLDEMR